MDNDILFAIFVILVFITFFVVVIGATINSNISEIKNILKSEGSGNFTDEDLEKIREIIVN